jgi:hypothetical protein
MAPGGVEIMLRVWFPCEESPTARAMPAIAVHPDGAGVTVDYRRSAKRDYLSIVASQPHDETSEALRSPGTAQRVISNRGEDGP